MKKTVLVRYYNEEGGISEMNYTADSKDAAKFAAYYRPKIRKGKILSVVILSVVTV